jgi:apolipoprotein N-acyltransferase
LNSALDRAAHAVVLSWGWRRFGIATLAGAVGALAMPPFSLFPALALSLAPAVWLLDGAAAGVGRFSRATLLSAAFTGWAFGFGYFVAGLWWLGAAFLVEPDQFAWALPLGVLGLPAGLALFHALGFVLARILWSSGAGRVLALAGGLAVSEWLRGTVLTGFPWNAYGMALGDHVLLAQSASLWGLNGLSAIALACGASFSTLATGHGARERLLAPGLALACLALLAGFGAWRIPAGPSPSVAGVKLRIMQPNIAQDDKFRPENREAIMRHYLTLSDRSVSPGNSGMAGVTHLIWPESSFPFLLARDPQALNQIATLLPKGATLVTGAVRAEEPMPGENRRKFYNSLQVVGDDGTLLDSADKLHLVPFGEYLPLSDLLTSLGLRQFVNTPGGFEAGTLHKLLQVPGMPPVAPLICYEAIFPGAVRPPLGRPGVMLNVTNDAWFGLTPGPHQHYAQARLRSVEEGLPLVRAANDGISAVVDPFGRELASLPLGVEGVLDSSLPEALEPPPFVRWGGLLSAILMLGCLGCAAISCIRD